MKDRKVGGCFLTMMGQVLWGTPNDSYYPMVNIQLKLLNMAREIVDLPMKRVDLFIVMYTFTRGYIK